MTSYRVVWDIDVEATDPIDAARKALEIQRDPGSLATIFRVTSGPYNNPVTDDVIDLEEVES